MRHQSPSTIKAVLACSLALSAAVVAFPAMAGDSSAHLRGQITSVSDHGFTMQTNQGEKRQIKLGSDTKIAAVTKGDLSHIKKGTFIGTANVKHGDQNRALEMVIFPASMKGSGLGNYHWDLTPAMVSNSGQAAGSSQSGGSSMTNGSVKSKSSDSNMSGGSSMTNGTVKNQSQGGQSTTLKVDYGKGSKTIVVPANVPTVQVHKGSKSDLKSGAHVFVAGKKGQMKESFTAKQVIVGKHGTVPPM